MIQRRHYKIGSIHVWEGKLSENLSVSLSGSVSPIQSEIQLWSKESLVSKAGHHNKNKAKDNCHYESVCN